MNRRRLYIALYSCRGDRLKAICNANKNSNWLVAVINILNWVFGHNQKKLSKLIIGIVIKAINIHFCFD